MSKKHDEFIAAFKRIEQNIKRLPNVASDANFKWLEDQMNDQALITKMRMCRLLRNYIQHEPDYESFITINDGMIEFLHVLNKSLCKSLDGLRPMMIPISEADFLSSDALVCDALARLTNGASSIVYYSTSTNQFGIFNQSCINEAILQGMCATTPLARMESLMKFGNEYVQVAYIDDAKDCYVNAISRGIRLIVKNATGDIIGLI